LKFILGSPSLSAMSRKLSHNSANAVASTLGILLCDELNLSPDVVGPLLAIVQLKQRRWVDNAPDPRAPARHVLGDVLHGAPGLRCHVHELLQANDSGRVL